VPTGRASDAGLPETSTIRRVAEALTIFLEPRADAGVSEIARSLGWSKSVAHRVLSGLASTGFLEADPVTRRYRLGAKAMQLGLAARNPANLMERSLPYLRHVRDRTGETGALNLLHGEVRVYAQQVESQEVVRQSVPLGREVPLHLGAGGKAILAFLADPARATMLARIPQRDALRIAEELQRIRRRGYAVSMAEVIDGTVSVGAPIFDRAGVVGSITAAGVAGRSNARRLAQFGAIVCEEAAELSRELGWTAERSRSLATPTATRGGPQRVRRISRD
jgi:DNA-binding IclR family transcriptional regulator